MTVPSGLFVLFALVGALLFNISRNNVWQQSVWLVLNLAFVWSFSHDLPALLPFAGFLVAGYGAQRISRRYPRLAGPLCIALILLLFVWLKRYSFVPAAMTLPHVYLTIGLSYVFFRVLHLVIDAAQGSEANPGPVSYLNYTLNFPAFISGPIQRWEDYTAGSNLPLHLTDIGLAAWRMVLGAFKVLILSDALHAWQTTLIAGLVPDLPFATRVLDGALIVVLYALFLYANFSGYTDFVIGVARLFRLRLPENFDHPFAATSFIEFWNRWHITLSQWLRSYVFNPVLLSWMRRDRRARGKQYPAIAALFLTFFLVGAWHGQTTEFLFFGLLQGGGVGGNRLYQVWMARRLTPAGYAALGAHPLYRAVARGLTFTWFAFTLLWFWATWQGIAAMATTLGVSGVLTASVGTILAASIVLSLPALLGPLSSLADAALQSRYTRTAFSAAMLLALVVATVVLNLSSPGIVYRQF